VMAAIAHTLKGWVKRCHVTQTHRRSNERARAALSLQEGIKSIVNEDALTQGCFFRTARYRSYLNGFR
jgi:hypothetical protein